MKRIERMGIAIRSSLGGGLFHDSRSDVNKLADALNVIIKKQNEIIDTVNKLVDKANQEER